MSYQQYQEITQKAADLNNAAALLSWDQETYMPVNGYAARGRQLATLAALAHSTLTSDEYGKLLQELNASDPGDEQAQANVRLSWEDYEKNAKLPESFVAEMSEAASRAFHAWVQARKQNKFSLFAAELEHTITLKKRQADLYGYQDHPYDALLDDYEKGASTALLEPIFAGLRRDLPPLMQAIAGAEQVDDSFLLKHYPREEQWAFSLELLKIIGYDFEAGRQDYSEHPFSTSFSSKDVRITTRVNENDLASLLWSSIHEAGHALYEQGLPDAQYGLPLGAATSLSIHESQSRLWENCVGRGISFWKYFYPALQTRFPQQLGDVSLEGFYAGMNKVSPSFIRTEADELSYHFHVMIRYEIEKLIMEGAVAVKDLPDLWNEKYRQYLGITPPDDQQGILQDVHWSHGSFGYFPTYSLGSFYAAQFWECAQLHMPDLKSEIEAGRFENLLGWLRKNIHQHGRLYRSEELCRRVTGKGLDVDAFLRYARNKYSAIYKLRI